MAASSRSRTVFLIAAGVGLALRLAFGLGFWVNEALTRDEVEYLSLARSLAAGRGLVFDEAVTAGPVEPFGRAPGYPAFLALVGGGAHVTATVPASVKVAQAVVGALGVFVIGLVATRLGGTRAGQAAAAIAAVYPPLILVSARAFSEAVFWPIGLLLAWQVDRTLEGDARNWRQATFAGALAGIAVLVRAGTLVFVPIVLAWLLWKRRTLAAIALAAGFLVVLTPWTIRNVAHYGRFVLVASDGGVTFWTGNNALATGEGDMAANPSLKIESMRLRGLHPDLNEEQMEPVYYREALHWIRTHPADWLVLMARKAFYLVVPIGPSYTLHSRRYYAATVLSVAILLPLAAIGLWRLGAARRRTPGLWLLFASAVAMCLLFFPQERFRLPIIDPALIVAAGTAWTVGGRDQDAGDVPI
jgi:4-amino-4-deoxy-L-arabinose transferase-like glycosyltransferase